MKELLLFILFLVVGAGMLIAGIMYMIKEKNDPESVRIYRGVSVIGAVLTVGAIASRILI